MNIKSWEWLVFALFCVFLALPGTFGFLGDMMVGGIIYGMGWVIYRSFWGNTTKEYYVSGLEHAKKGEHNQAIANFTKAIELSRDDAERAADAYYNRGVVYGKGLGDHSRELEDYNVAIELNPSFDSAYYSRATVFGMQGNFDKAIVDYGKLIALKPSYALAYAGRALAYASKGEHHEAIVDYTKVIELEPGNARAYASRGAEYLSLEETVKAESDFAQQKRLARERDVEEIALRIANGLEERRVDWARLSIAGMKAAADKINPTSNVSFSGDITLVVRAFQYVHVSSFVYAENYLDEVRLGKFIKTLGAVLFGDDLKKSLPYINQYTKAKQENTGDNFLKQFVGFSEDVALGLTGSPTGMVFAPMASAGVLDFYWMSLGVAAYEFGDNETYSKILSDIKQKYKA